LPAINTRHSWALTLILWFAALARGAHDQWAACLVFLTISLLCLAFLIAAPRANNPSLLLPLLLPGVFWLAYAYINTRYSLDPQSSILEYWICLFLIISFYLFLNIHQNPTEKQAFWDRTGWVVFPLLAVALYQQCQAIHSGYLRLEVTSTLINANNLAGFTLFWFGHYGIRWNEERRWSLGIPFFASGLLFLMSGSLLAWIIQISAVCWLFRSTLQKYWFQHQTRFISVAALIGIVLFLLILHKVSDNSGPYRETGRVIYWTTALRMLLDHPFFGIGLGAYGAAYPVYRAVDGTVVQNSRFAHSSALEFVSEAGITGVLILVICYRLWRKQSAPAPSLSLALTAFLLFSLINLHLSYFVNKLLLVLALASSLNHIGSTWVLTPIRRWSIAIALVLIIPLWASPFQAERLRLEGNSLEKQGDYPKATQYYLDALSLDSRNIEARGGLSRMQALRDKTD